MATQGVVGEEPEGAQGGTPPKMAAAAAAAAAADSDDLSEADLMAFTEDLERFAEDSFIQQALHQGVDLRSYSHQIEQELRDVEVESVRDYVSQSEQVVDLHNQMQSCDAILAKMQEMLLGFQVKTPLVSVWCFCSIASRPCAPGSQYLCLWLSVSLSRSRSHARTRTCTLLLRMLLAYAA